MKHLSSDLVVYGTSLQYFCRLRRVLCVSAVTLEEMWFLLRSQPPLPSAGWLCWRCFAVLWQWEKLIWESWSFRLTKQCILNLKLLKQQESGIPEHTGNNKISRLMFCTLTTCRTCFKFCLLVISGTISVLYSMQGNLRKSSGIKSILNK